MKKHRYRASTETLQSLERSTIDPLPYYPNLRRLLASHGAALLLIYLEAHFQPPQDSPDSPVLLHISRLTRDLQLQGRELWRYISFIATRFNSAAERGAAVVAGREFYRADRRWGIGAIKCYSLTAAGPGTYTLRRNYLRLHSLLDAAGIGAQLAAWPNQPHINHANATGAQTAPVTNRDGDERRPASSLACAQFDAVILRRPEVVAAEVARSLNKISGLGDGRMVAGLKRRPHNRRPWTPERRAKYEATMERKRVGGAQPNQGPPADGDGANDVW